MEYTKGEWKVDNREEGVGYFSVNLPKATFPYIINMPSPPFAMGRAGAIITTDPMNPDRALANAHLIATSPEMYEALKKIQEWLMFKHELASGQDYNEQLVKANNLTIKVLAKAEGKE